jgi:hypothetical protein
MVKDFYCKARQMRLRVSAGPAGLGKHNVTSERDFRLMFPLSRAYWMSACLVSAQETAPSPRVEAQPFATAVRRVAQPLENSRLAYSGAAAAARPALEADSAVGVVTSVEKTFESMPESWRAMSGPDRSGPRFCDRA